MRDLTQSSWFLSLTIIATFLTLITGTAAIIKFLNPLLRKHLNSYTDTVDNGLRNESNINPSSKTKSIANDRDYRTKQDRRYAIIINTGVLGGALIGAIVVVKLGYQQSWSIAEFILSILGVGFLGAFLGMIVAGTPVGFIDARRERILRVAKRETLLAPLRKDVAENPSSTRARYRLASAMHDLSSAWPYAQGREQKQLRAEALSEVRHALQLNPKDARLHLLLGWILSANEKPGPHSNRSFD